MNTTSNILQETLQQLAPTSMQLQTTPELYSNIILTQEETQEALRLAREAKHLAQLRTAYMEKIKSQPLIRKFTAEELFDMLCKTHDLKGRPFKLRSKKHRKILVNLCCYFAGDDRFQGDPQKGILLMGPKGTGKTHLMRFFQQNARQSYSLINTRKIEEAWVNEAKEKEVPIPTIQRYSANRTLGVNENAFGHKEAGWCFDDMGSESQNAKSFGQERNLLAEILCNRYDNNLPFISTHITTNLNGEQIVARYGERTAERIREGMNQFILEGDSFRN